MTPLGYNKQGYYVVSYTLKFPDGSTSIGYSTYLNEDAYLAEKQLSDKLTQERDERFLFGHIINKI